MRIVTKINLTLVAAVVLAAGSNFATMQATVLPIFYDLEEAASQRNQGRAEEAIASIESQVAQAAWLYASFDGIAAAARAGASASTAHAPKEDLLREMGIDHVALLDGDGRILFDHDLGEAGNAHLLSGASLPAAHPLRASQPGGVRSGLMSVGGALVAVGTAPVETSGPAAAGIGTVLLARSIDVSALSAMTKVKFRLEPASGAGTRPAFLRLPDAIEARKTLAGVDGQPVAELVTVTTRRNVGAGQTAIGWASGLMLVSMLVVLACLSVAIRLIAVRRIERMRAHLSGVAETGSLGPMTEDRGADELSDTIVSFNAMARQLAELRSELRQRDYRHGAADQAAGLLHNLRNAVSPIAAIAWALEARDKANWQATLTKVLAELERGDLDPARAAKLDGLLILCAREALKAGAGRQADLRTLQAMIGHVEEILREQDHLSQTDRQPEAVDVAEAVAQAVRRVAHRPGLVFDIRVFEAAEVLGYRVVFDQILDNLLVNAAQAIEATPRGTGRIAVEAVPGLHDGLAAVEIRVIDDGDGIAAGDVAGLFANGFSTRRERSGGLGLHWCANAVNAMGGSLSAQSSGPGEGATLRLVLPATNAQQRIAA
ncbi:ATP-binding protein [Aureimonas sp. AU12]|uniref:sensor histidine kinase n=1 Tax=Aureimonas sp. AU12 TaxID=1638161 RepID=UPI000706A92F|nr:ATP-binding protein [Aureimonas sp. AU12]BAT29739.1 integral membrane sensor signal transduction histidine kinase precursor [Aureimonas sp. AU12]